jgi:hypothetical protein
MVALHFQFAVDARDADVLKHGVGVLAASADGYGVSFYEEKELRKVLAFNYQMTHRHTRPPGEIPV